MRRAREASRALLLIEVNRNFVEMLQQESILLASLAVDIGHEVRLLSSIAESHDADAQLATLRRWSLWHGVDAEKPASDSDFFSVGDVAAALEVQNGGHVGRIDLLVKMLVAFAGLHVPRHLCRRELALEHIFDGIAPPEQSGAWASFETCCFTSCGEPAGRTILHWCHGQSLKTRRDEVKMMLRSSSLAQLFYKHRRVGSRWDGREAARRRRRGR